MICVLHHLGSFCELVCFGFAQQFREEENTSSILIALPLTPATRIFFPTTPRNLIGFCLNEIKLVEFFAIAFTLCYVTVKIERTKFLFITRDIHTSLAKKLQCDKNVFSITWCKCEQESAPEKYSRTNKIKNPT